MMMVAKQQHFVLVHGAGHGGWCWFKVAPLLEKAGHRVTTLDMVGTGENTEIVDDVTSLEQYKRPLEDLFRSFPDDKKVNFYLGGVCITRVSEIFPKKILVAVYMTALMPAPGMNSGFLMATDPEFFPPTEGVQDQFILRSKVEGGPVTAMKFPLDRMKLGLYNRSSAEDFALASERCTWFPTLNVLVMEVPSTVENYGSVPRVYVLALDDGAISPASARKMIALNPPNEVYEIDGDHSLFFSASVGKILVDVASKY